MAHPQVHQLRHQQTGHCSTLTLLDTHVSTATETGGKTRRTAKHFATAAEAATYAERQEWQLLKKGFVLNQAAAPGEPLLHCFVGGGYTGSLAFAATPQGLYVYQHGWFRSATDQQDFLLQLDAAGCVLDTLALPSLLAWDAHYQPAWHALVLDLDHQVFEYGLDTGRFQLLSEPAGQWSASFVAVAAGRTAFAANNELVVLGPDRRALFRQPFVTQLLDGSLVFAAALAPSGHVLAVQTSPGAIQLYSILDGTLLHTLTGDFGRVQQLEFMADDQRLLVLHGPGRLRCFDLVRYAEADFTLAGSEAWFPQVKTCCLNADQSRLAVMQGTGVELFDTATRQLLHRFKLAHCVKTARLRFIGETLGVRTDYGCFSLYQT